MTHPAITRDDVIALLNKLVRLRWRGINAQEIPVQFLENRIGVVLPATPFPIDEQIRLKGKFQSAMTRRGAHAFLDFVTEWQGRKTPFRIGFN